MKQINSFSKFVLLAVGVASAASIASANTVQYTYTGETGGGVIMGITTPDYNGNARVGEFIMTTTTPGFAPTLLTYCTDVGAILANTFNYTPTALGSATGVSPAWISGGIQNAAKLWYNDKSAATTATQTAGLQLAIWQLLYNNVGGSYSTSTFNNTANNGFHITTTDTGTVAAETYAASVLNNFNTLPATQSVGWLAPTLNNGTTGGSQGLLYQTPSPTGVPSVPDATSTLALLGMAVVTLGIVSQRVKAVKA